MQSTFQRIVWYGFCGPEKDTVHLLIDEVRQFLLELKAIIVCFVLHGGTWWYV